MATTQPVSALPLGLRTDAGHNLRRPRRSVDSSRPLKFYRRNAGNRSQRSDPLSLDDAGKNADAGQRRVRPKPERTARVHHFFHSLEGIVSDRNGNPDSAHLGYGA
jgi:hypothetical protein